MLAAYERLTREVQLLDTGEGKGLPNADASAEPDNQLDAFDPGTDQPSDANSDPAADPEAPADVPERDHWVHDEEPKSCADIMSMLGKPSSGMIHLHCLQEARPKRMWMTIESFKVS